MPKGRRLPTVSRCLLQVETRDSAVNTVRIQYGLQGESRNDQAEGTVGAIRIRL